jgi:hypothetical protein
VYYHLQANLDDYPADPGEAFESGFAADSFATLMIAFFVYMIYRTWKDS